MADNANSTSQELLLQWISPSDIFSVLLIVGGDIIQKALAQFASLRYAPVCLSFGWVAYAFNTFVSMTGNGRLMPEIDNPCKVINLKNGYKRECKSWSIGRFLMDDSCTVMRQTLGLTMGVDYPGSSGLSVSVYVWDTTSGGQHVDLRQFEATIFMVVQLVISALPWILKGDWGVFLITAGGTALALCTGCILHQWRAEAFACRKNVKKDIAITQGNGASHVLIVRTMNNGLDFEDLATGRGPRFGSIWESTGIFTTPKDTQGRAMYRRLGRHDRFSTGPKEKTVKQQFRRAMLWRGLPLDFWLTRLLSSILGLCWILLLITAAGVQQNAWYLLLVGSLGMLQNGRAAGASCRPHERGFHVRRENLFSGHKVMDVLMDLDSQYSGMGKALLEEFFPGNLTTAEKEWWNGDKSQYDQDRSSVDETQWRGLPGSSKITALVSTP